MQAAAMQGTAGCRAGIAVRSRQTSATRLIDHGKMKKMQQQMEKIRATTVQMLMEQMMQRDWAMGAMPAK